MAGISPRRCLGLAGAPCSAKIRGASRCRRCSAAWEQNRERERSGRRKRTEPWRMLYSTPDWRLARSSRLRIDGGACVDCAARNGVSVDHVIPLRRLWTIHVLERGNDVDAFVRAACDLEQLRTRCSSCHGTIEAQRRKTT